MSIITELIPSLFVKQSSFSPGFICRRSSARLDLAASNELLKVKETDGSKLRLANESLENKCSRLREYIKKLTAKCEEWEVSYERQAKSIEKLQAKNVRIRERASEMVHRYRRLAGDVRRKSKVRLNMLRKSKP